MRQAIRVEVAMFCPYCRAEIVEGTTFCPTCGKQIQEPDSNNPNPKPDVVATKNPKPAFLSTTKGKVILFGGIAAVVIAGLIVYFAVFRITPAIFDPLPNTGPKSSFYVDQEVSDTTINTDWVPVDDFVVTNVTENERQEFDKDGERFCTLISTVEFENSSLKASKRVYETFMFQRENKKWVKADAIHSDDAILTPTKGVDTDMVEESVQTLIELADKNPKKDANGKPIYLRDCYKKGATFEVTKNNTTADGGNVIIAMRAPQGTKTYNGTLTATFSWDGKAWVVDSCKADDAAYQAK